jgi:hypothetical protein
VSSSLFRNPLLQKRLVYLGVTAAVLAAGYLSRQWSVKGSFIHDYAGDAVWAAMIYFGFRFLLAGEARKQALVAALATTFLIEISQLVQADWLNALRHTRLGGLILGFVFLWSDLVMYSVGIGLAWLADGFFLRRGR